MDSSGDATSMLLVRNAWFDSGYMFCISASLLLDELHFLCRGGLGSSDALSPFLCRMEKCAQPMLQLAVPHCAARTWKFEVPLMRLTSLAVGVMTDGMAGSLGLDSQVTCHQLVSATVVASLLYFVAIHIAHLNPSPKQQKYNLERLRFNRRGASTSLRGVESCSLLRGWPSPMSSGHHTSMEHRLRRKHVKL